MPNAEKRHILASTYGNEFGEDSAVLFAIYPDVVAMAIAAQKAATAFDESRYTEGYHGGSTVETPTVGGDYVMTSLPDGLSEWLEEQGDPNLERVHLLPVGLADQIDAQLRFWEEDNDDAIWRSRNCRLRCDEDDIRLAIDDKYEGDITVWTRSFAAIVHRLADHFDADGMSVDLEGNTRPEVPRA